MLKERLLSHAVDIHIYISLVKIVTSKEITALFQCSILALPCLVQGTMGRTGDHLFLVSRAE